MLFSKVQVTKFKTLTFWLGNLVARYHLQRKYDDEWIIMKVLNCANEEHTYALTTYASNEFKRVYSSTIFFSSANSNTINLLNY